MKKLFIGIAIISILGYEIGLFIKEPPAGPTLIQDMIKKQSEQIKLLEEKLLQSHQLLQAQINGINENLNNLDIYYKVIVKEKKNE